MNIITYDLHNPKIVHLMSTDSRLCSLIKLVGSCELQIEEDGFRCLVKYIIGQQISDKARETLWKRMQLIGGGVTVSNIQNVNIETIRSIGLSERKAGYIKELANNIANGTVVLDELINMTNDQVISKLTAIKGIGKWTAEMFLVFSLGRENVLSSGDGTIKRVAKWLYEMNELPTSDRLCKLFEKWKGYETIVSVYFWAAIAAGLTTQPMGQLRF